MRLKFIDALRGIAVGMVLIFHAGVWAGLPAAPMRVLGLGHVGVDLFFVISGFCMVWPLAAKGPHLPVHTLRFYARRVRRIVPPYYAAVALAVAASAATYLAGGKSWWGLPFQDVWPLRDTATAMNLGSHALFVHGFFPQYAHAIEGSFWSLATEWQFYLLFPILLVLCRRLSPLVTALTTLFGSLLFLAAVHQVAPHEVNNYVVNGSLAARLGEFGVGMAAALAVASGRFKPGRGRPGWLVFAGAYSAVAAAEVLRPEMFFLPVAWAIVFGGLVLLAADLPTPRIPAAAVALGAVSYSAYLVHDSVFMMLSIPLSRAGAPMELRALVYFTVGLVATVASAVIFYRVVESRFVRGPRRLSAVLRERAAHQTEGVPPGVQSAD